MTEIKIASKNLQHTARTRSNNLDQAYLKLELFDNIQFIYELALAKLELEALGVNFEVTNSLRLFLADRNLDKDYLRRRVAYFKTIDGELTDYYFIQKRNQTHSVNQYLTHWIYPYKGKFHPQMIRAFLNIMNVKKGETVLDPFIGSGTTALESQLLGINSIGIDVSPLCVLISKVKTESINVLETIYKHKDNVFPSNAHLGNQNTLFARKISEISRDERVRDFFKAAEMIAHSDFARRKKDFNKSFHENVLRMYKSVQDFRDVVTEIKLELGKTNIMEGDARHLPLADESIDGIITSPPYSIALNYVQNDAHALSALGYDLNKIKEDFIGVRGQSLTKFDLYEDDMKLAYKEMFRVLKPGRYCSVIVGNVTFQGREIDTTQHAIDHCEELGFHLVRKIEKIIYGLYNIMQKEYILIFKK